MRIIPFIFLGSLMMACNQNPTPKSENSDSDIQMETNEQNKEASSEIENKRWRLVELDGAAYQPDKKMETVFFILDSNEKRISGNLGCNTFFGSYKIEENKLISFSKLGSTMKACRDMSTEKEMQVLLRKANNFSIVNGVLYLKQDRVKKLAGFKPEEVKS